MKKEFIGGKRSLVVSAAALIAVALLVLSPSAFGQETGFVVTSPAFKEGAMIPGEYSCTGRNISPPLKWEGLPEGCVSIAIVMDDPDAPGGTWLHWLIWNIDPAPGEIPKALDAAAIGATVGKNSWRKAQYDGPCPPSGTHRYRFNVYALSEKVDLESGSGKRSLMKAIKDITLAEFTLTGRYSK
ncbi:MAG: YbhB/YbcL family Raf kinase inhibitor-like protein [Deltaproteobacteria bacterium]|uniref:YbhB/YbcL family Raf kinase inhibitor-like protein n=1 Tax=Candidatus Zymogenus saltonus TaxID=2844893 RepID=A0A9D8KDF4_9DELT|nr:YbhB/YbcL family Raf kinase inhibitor-like protein [Candidatus Zymogenus saltonus]